MKLKSLQDTLEFESEMPQEVVHGAPPAVHETIDGFLSTKSKKCQVNVLRGVHESTADLQAQDQVQAVKWKVH